MYNDIPTLDQWKKDTTIDGKRDGEFLARIDIALGDLQSAMQNRLRSTDAEVLQLMGLYLRHQVTLCQSQKKYGNDHPIAFRLSLLRKIVSEKILTSMGRKWDARSNYILDTRYEEEVITGMTAHGVGVDTGKGGATYLNPSELWKYRIYVNSGQIQQLPWWDTSTDFSTSRKYFNACTLQIPEVGKGLHRFLKAEEEPKNISVELVRVASNNDLQESLGDAPALYCYGPELKWVYDQNLQRYLTEVTSNPQIKAELRLKIYFINGKYCVRSMPEVLEPTWKVAGIVDIETHLSKDQFEDTLGKYRLISLGDEHPFIAAEYRYEWDRKMTGWTSPYLSEIACTSGFVMGVDGELYMAKQEASDRIFHSYYFRGKPVLSAGTIMVDPRGHLLAISNCSGHYQPHASTLLHVLRYFRNKKVDISKAIVVTIDATDTLKFYYAQDFLESFGRVKHLSWNDENVRSTIIDHVMKDRKFVAPDNTEFTYPDDEFWLYVVVKALGLPLPKYKSFKYA